MNNNAIFLMNFNNSSVTSNKLNFSNKSSTDLFEKALESANNQSKVSSNRKNTNTFKKENKLGTKKSDIKNDKKDIQTTSNNSDRQIKSEKYSNKESSETKVSEKDTSNNEKNIDIAKDSEDEVETIAEVNETLELLLKLIDEHMNVDSKDEMENELVANYTNSDLNKQIEDICVQLKELTNTINDTNIIGTDKTMFASEMIQEINEIIDILELDTRAISDSNSIIDFRIKLETLISSLSELNNVANNLNTNLIQSDIVGLEKNEKNSEDLLVQENSEASDIELNNENISTELSDAEANLSSNNGSNNSFSKSMQNVIINTDIQSNSFSTDVNDFGIEQSSLQKYVTLNKNSIFEQLVDKIKVDSLKNSDEVKIKLKPEILGEMTIKIVLEKGTVTARVMVENYQIKQLLESNVDQLKENFKNEGLNFQALDVSVNKDSEFDRNNAQSWNHRSGSKKIKVKLDDAIVGNLYDEVNDNTTNIMSEYSTSLDLIV